MPVELTWYVTFISIVFGVFISVWIQPLERDEIKERFPPKGVSDILFLARGILMFAILICLWWWYAIFLGNIDPLTASLCTLTSSPLLRDSPSPSGIGINLTYFRSRYCLAHPLC